MTRLLEFLRRSPRGVLASSLAVALLLGALSLRFGFLLDDYVHRSAARGQMGPMTGFRLFDFATGDAEVTRRFIHHGPFPWWTELASCRAPEWRWNRLGRVSWALRCWRAGRG
jgi:hypothetical protein